MKSLLKRFKKLISALVVSMICIPTAVFAYNYNNDSKEVAQSKAIAANTEEINNISSKTISDIHKEWIVRLNSAVDVNSLLNSVEVRDLTDGSKIVVTVEKGDDSSSIKIVPPSNGYTIGHSYQVTVNKKLRSKKGKNLKRTGLMQFKVVDIESGNYTAAAKVSVGTAPLNMIKQITITSSNFSDVKKVKIEGNNKVYKIGETIPVFTKESSATVYFYGSDGETVISEATLDVSKSNNSTLKLTNEE